MSLLPPRYLGIVKCTQPYPHIRRGCFHVSNSQHTSHNRTSLPLHQGLVSKKAFQFTRLRSLRDLGRVRCTYTYLHTKKLFLCFKIQTHDTHITVEQPYHCTKAHRLKGQPSAQGSRNCTDWGGSDVCYLAPCVMRLFFCFEPITPRSQMSNLLLHQGLHSKKVSPSLPPLQDLGGSNVHHLTRVRNGSFHISNIWHLVTMEQPCHCTKATKTKKKLKCYSVQPFNPFYRLLSYFFTNYKTPYSCTVKWYKLTTLPYMVILGPTSIKTT